MDGWINVRHEEHECITTNSVGLKYYCFTYKLKRQDEIARSARSSGFQEKNSDGRGANLLTDTRMLCETEDEVILHDA